MVSLDHGQHIAIVERHGQVLRSLPGAVVGEWSLSIPERLKATDEMHLQFGDAQLSAYAAASHGWFFWNYRDAEDLWNVSTCIGKGWLPCNLGSMPKQTESHRTGCTSVASYVLPRTPPPGRFPQCYGSEERRILAEMHPPGEPSKVDTPDAGSAALQHGQKRPRSDSHDEA